MGLRNSGIIADKTKKGIDCPCRNDSPLFLGADHIYTFLQIVYFSVATGNIETDQFIPFAEFNPIT
jgi:hypothetical protein